MYRPRLLCIQRCGLRKGSRRIRDIFICKHKVSIIITNEIWAGKRASICAPCFAASWCRLPFGILSFDTGSMSERKAVIKNADMSEDMQQDAIDCATQVPRPSPALRPREQLIL